MIESGGFWITRSDGRSPSLTSTVLPSSRLMVMGTSRALPSRTTATRSPSERNISVGTGSTSVGFALVSLK